MQQPRSNFSIRNADPSRGHRSYCNIINFLFSFSRQNMTNLITATSQEKLFPSKTGGAWCQVFCFRFSLPFMLSWGLSVLLALDIQPIFPRTRTTTKNSRCWCPKKTSPWSMSTFSRRESWSRRRTFKPRNTLLCQEFRIFTSSNVCSLWSHEDTWRSSLLGGTSTGILPTKESNSWGITFIFLLRSFLRHSGDRLNRSKDDLREVMAEKLNQIRKKLEEGLTMVIEEEVLKALLKELALEEEDLQSLKLSKWSNLYN